jgi:hypothetical protein
MRVDVATPRAQLRNFATSSCCWSLSSCCFHEWSTGFPLRMMCHLFILVGSQPKGCPTVRPPNEVVRLAELPHLDPPLDRERPALVGVHDSSPLALGHGHRRRRPDAASWRPSPSARPWRGRPGRAPSRESRGHRSANEWGEEVYVLELPVAGEQRRGEVPRRVETRSGITSATPDEGEDGHTDEWRREVSGDRSIGNLDHQKHQECGHRRFRYRRDACAQPPLRLDEPVAHAG